MRFLRREASAPQPAWVGRASAGRIWRAGLANPASLAARAGLSGAGVVPRMPAARLKLTAAGAIVGSLGGAALSSELAALAGLLGGAWGYLCIPRALEGQARRRTAQMERHLPEMLDVVVLGLQSGMSFERSFGLYPEYFDTGLARSMARVVRQWEMGLVTREEALRGLEREYDSALLARAVGAMMRSLRFGTSIAESLSQVAVESREVYRARMEERVAKAAVKMMLPVGTLILPAMLILVLGPVMLELVQGF